MTKLKLPLNKTFPVTQIFNDVRFRSSYTKFGLLGHNGLDFGCPQGTEVVAPHEGKILENAFDATGYGNYVKIENDNEFSVLGHLKELSKIKIGTTVKQGEVVGISGNTGNSTGAHLHWGYCWKPRNSANGFNGYVDQQLVMAIQASIPDLTVDLQEMRDSRDEWKKKSKEQAKEIIKLNEKIKELQETPAPTTAEPTAPEVVAPTPEETAFFKKLLDSFVAWLGINKK